jgi:hypothetical protein
MSDKIARLGIKRDNNLMYYIKNGDVWATPRKQKGQPKGKAQKIAVTGIELDYSRYLYFLDGDGDVARKERALGGSRKAKSSKAKPSKAPKPSKAVASPPARKPHEMAWSGKGKKSEAQLDAEIAECLAQAKKGGNGGNGNGAKSSGNGNGTKAAGKPAGKKTKAKAKKKRS